MVTHHTAHKQKTLCFSSYGLMVSPLGPFFVFVVRRSSLLILLSFPSFSVDSSLLLELSGMRCLADEQFCGSGLSGC